jgi:hypothetical protein
MTEADLSELRARLERLEAESAIRGVVADYMRLCDRLDETTSMEELGALFTREATWAGRGARCAEAFGAHRGRGEIVAMLDSYRTPSPHFALNVHHIGSEKIVVEGETASGAWVMLQTSSYTRGGSDLKAARLHIGFAREDGRWRISRFETENLFSRPVDRWDDPAAASTAVLQGD